MTSPHIIDIRWRIAADEKAKAKPPLAMPGQPSWHSHRFKGQWGIVAHIPGTDQGYFEPVTQAEFDAVNSRYHD